MSKMRNTGVILDLILISLLTGKCATQNLKDAILVYGHLRLSTSL